MRKSSLILWIAFLPFMSNCQQKTQNLNTGKYQNKIFNAEEWKTLLEKFPTRDKQFLLNMNQVALLKDTISRQLLNNYFTNDTISYVEGNYNKVYKFFYPSTKLRGEEILYPIGSLPPIVNDSSFQCTYQSGSEGLYPYRVYPLGKIFWSDSLTMVLWGYPQPYEEFYFVTAYVINKNYEKVGHFGFMYSDKWRHCEDSIAEIMKNSEPLSYPFELQKNGFRVRDKMVGSYYDESLDEQILDVEINQKGQFEIVREKKIYENKIELWSKAGYRVQDADGYVNLRDKPTTSGDVISKLTNGTLVTIIDASKDWWLIKTADHQKGFIHKSRIVEGQ